MQLTSIKLSGFKSFVDPTTIQINGKLIGVVGPNGCGKSNIIDAVRWVLGESRASELRGESMRDVIFNGTTQRRPAGRASVELTFDNSDGRVGGQWGKYGELAVKRVLTREGGSTYFINNVTVRRRDVQDIFLGTGLGPRAYAIIGQGMIARIIEARPEELRVFLEEAAGVSKYRERRRETENRLVDTRENLNRVSDILHELNQNLEKLRVQADLAKQYQNLVDARDRQQKLLWLVQKQASAREQAELAQEIEKAQTALEAMTADLFKREAELEKLREAHDMANQKLHAAQGELYKTNAEIGSLEAQIRYVIETRKRLQAQVLSFQDQKDQWSRQIITFSEELASGRQDLEEAILNCEAAQELCFCKAEELPRFESLLSEMRGQAQEIHDRILQIRQQIAVSSSNHKNLADILQECQIRREKLLQQQKQIAEPDMNDLVTKKDEEREQEHLLEELRLNEEFKQDQISEIENKCRVARERLNECKTRHLQGEARLVTLKQLQDKTQSKSKLHDWLEKHELTGFNPLWQSVHTDPEWETALEAVLSERIRAIELSSLDWAKPFSKETLPARICFFSAQGAGTGTDNGKVSGMDSLVDLVYCDKSFFRDILENWLCHVYVADNLEQALQRRETLPKGACFVVPDGHIVDRQSVRLFALESETDGVFSRQQEIERLECVQEEMKSELSQAMERFRSAETELDEAQMQIQNWRNQATNVLQRIHEIRLSILKLEEADRLYRDQKIRIDTDLSELYHLIQDKEADLQEEEKRLEELDMLLAEWQGKEESSYDRIAQEEEKLGLFREELRQAERKAQQAEFEKETLVKRIAELERQIQTAESQVRIVSGNLDQGQLELQELDDKIAQENLQMLLETRMTQENALVELRQNLDDLAQQLRVMLEGRLQLERGLQPQRDKIVSLQLKEQAARINVEQYDQKLAEVMADVRELTQWISPHAKASAFQSEISRLSAEIDGLGPVNLGAAMELDEGEKRQKYLQEQYQDLTDAIVTLEDAIRRIDRETRMLLKNTFDQVNSSLNELFPVLFGGGHARLLMTGNEILDAGVQIMAQPPGKKNATIHLLSGGEKALTAIALVFSLFQLNPAPFCLLDEVDAPLDDANTERFSNMVTKMSEQTQFLFISHNRIAMEMAEELVGVTMQEQGVSRIVTVDINDAAKFSDEVLRA
ncbi:chromosome segregation protein SMC [Oxalobacter aliiformigenes]|uniref:chromosome segregation protein SMC n=1 Tax=Oxalobacter aliiformigenes TaxID=2946593 RepID=UPI0022AF5E82|nr:chromosome segregation protein SMC [Oxalobacter aliiformigenes]MCZ4064027.1 chromosome segregation protein SMC [Oxalobacter aliiformigenes]WAV99404.1 chromosome segregation protein SMC [Oxalobacter aliiformigenes]